MQAIRLLPVLLLGGHDLRLADAQVPAAVQTQGTNLQAEMDEAIQRVREIVNQPVRQFASRPGLKVARYSPGWFHEGATKPDFNNVDVRATQESIYDQHPYVTSDLNPGVVFVGRDLEFNTNTKYFYTDRSLPKKKLSEEEMLEINRLYRVIGNCEQQFAALRHPHTPTAPKTDPEPGPALASIRGRIPTSNYVYGGGAILLVLALYGIYRKWGR